MPAHDCYPDLLSITTCIKMAPEDVASAGKLRKARSCIGSESSPWIQYA